MNRSASWPRPTVATSPALPGFAPRLSYGWSSRVFLRRHALWPLLAWLALSLLSMGLGGDFWLADRLYAWQGGHWSLQIGRAHV